MREDSKAFIFDNGDDSGIDYSDLYECEEEEDPEEIIEEMRGTVQSGDCMLCGAKDSMTYEGNICFVCSKCKRSVHEDLYYLWLSGYDIESDDEDSSYEDIYG